MNSVPGAPGAFGPEAPIQMGPGGVNLRPPMAGAPPIQNAPGTNVPMASPSPEAMAATFGRSKPPASSDDPGITGMPALPKPPDLSNGPVTSAYSAYQADAAKQAALKAPRPEDYKPTWGDRLRGGLIGALTGGLSGSADKGEAIGSRFTNRKFNTAQGDYSRQSSALDKQLATDRGVFSAAEKSGEVPQTDFENKFKVAKEQREQQSATANADYKSAIADIRKDVAANNLDMAQKKMDEASQKNKNDFDYHRELLDLRKQILDAREGAAGKAKPAQSVGIEAKKATALAKAKTQYDKETELAGNDADARKQANENFKQAQQDAQDAYEAEINAAGGTAQHQEASTWNGKGAKPAASAPTKQPPTPGEVRTVKGQKMKITKVHKDGTFDADPVKEGQ